MRWSWIPMLLLVGCDGDDDDGGDGKADDGTCTTWVGTYDLTGSVMNIDALFDYTITLQEPYDADLNMGPGTIEVRFTDVDGAAGDGPVVMTSYEMTQDFVTGAVGFASVHTSLVNTVADPCGIAWGTLTGTTVAWSPTVIDNHCQTGEISCTGTICGSSGTPPEGEPEIFDNRCGTLDLVDYSVAEDFSDFTAVDSVVVRENDDLVSELTAAGKAVTLVRDKNTPECLCP